MPLGERPANLRGRIPPGRRRGEKLRMQTPISRARHDLRGRVNALKLCVSALEVCDTQEETLEFLDMIERAAEKAAVAMEDMERVFDQHGGWTEAEVGQVRS